MRASDITRAQHDGFAAKLLKIRRFGAKRYCLRTIPGESLGNPHQLGIRVHIAPGHTEVKSMRGIQIVIDELPGMCRKTRQSIPASIRRGLEKNPEIAYHLLDAHDLFRGA